MNFDPTAALWGLIGGLLIGCGAALLLLANGRIGGISGIFARAISLRPVEERWEAVAFVAALILAPMAYHLALGMPDITVTSNLPVLGLAGLAVGFGTATGGGCTSGHGVCGMTRLSPRSLVATLTFMVVGVLVAAFIRPAIGG